MPDDHTITLALQEGFADDTVVITADGKTLERLEHVSTRMQIGLAREIALNVPRGTRLTIALADQEPGQQPGQAVDLVTGDEAHYSVSVDRQTGQIAVRRSATPFGYV